VQRIQTHQNLKIQIINALINPKLKPKKILVVNIDINKIIPYSDIKIIAKEKEAYSILNPETSSLSPSEKSKGVRLLSATQEINHTNNKGTKNKILLNHIELSTRILIFNDPPKNKIFKKIIANLISYEMVCATPRNAPIRAYFLFEDHPIKIRGYEPKVKTVNTNNTLNSWSK
jgi:hypothetical protein